MPYQVSWLVEDRVLYFELYGTFNNTDFHAMMTEGRELVDGGTAPVHIITDMSAVETTEIGMEDFKRRGRDRSPKLGLSVNVTPRRAERFVSSIGARIMGFNPRHFATVEKAIEFLQRMDTSLPDMDVPARR
ncbi:MAG: hypothetical protein L0154_13590 [Chloroflexi bacterium]|nr:hypothetical protein [Chloroflexota bacterium]